MEDWKFGGHQTLRLEKKVIYESGKYHQPISITNERNTLRTYVFCSDMIALPLKIFLGGDDLFSNVKYLWLISSLRSITPS